MLAARSPSALQIWRVKAATEVFPLVPVIAAIVCGWRAKNFAAASARARRTLPTWTKATPSGSAVGSARSAMTAAAPAASAGATKRKPSSFAPAIATNRSPGLMVRLSALMPVTSSAARRASMTASGEIGKLHGSRDRLLLLQCHRPPVGDRSTICASI